MKYLIYKITNKVNNKIYIGKHKTKEVDDGYLGSGKLIKRAVSKYGIENFRKDILHIFDTEEEMNAKERELVTEDFCLKPNNYNLCAGGQGGFSFINRHTRQYPQAEMERKRVESISKTHKARGIKPPGYKLTDEEKYQRSVDRKREIREGLHPHTFSTTNNPMKDPFLRAKHKEAIRGKSKGSNNSQFGSVWITNGNENKKIKAVDVIPEGWYKGRHIPPSTGRSGDQTLNLGLP